MTIEEQENDGIKNAMKAHDKVRLETMRNIKKVILEAKTRPGANDRIDDAECIKLIQKLAKQGKESAEIYRQQGKKIVLVSLAAALVSGGGYFAFAERAESAYVEVGLCDYWPGDKVRRDRYELPEKFNSLIIGNADGKSDMYLLTGYIVAL